MLERVQRHPDRPIANRVDHHLPALLVQQRHNPRQLQRREVGRARRAPVCIRRQHRGGVRFDDAVGVELDGTGLQQRIVWKLFTQLTVALELGGGDPRFGADRGVDTQVELAAAPQSVV